MSSPTLLPVHPRLLLLQVLLLLQWCSSLLAVQQRQQFLPLFRPPNDREVKKAASTGAPFVWSAHAPSDALYVVANDTSLGLACLLDNGDSEVDGGRLPLELSWIIEDPDATTGRGVQTRHTLTTGATAATHQAFSLDLGPGLRPATGLFHQSMGSVLTLAFPAPMPGPLSISCHLRLGGIITARSPRLRLWDERPVVNALVESSQNEPLSCKRGQHRLATLTVVTLDCSLKMSPSKLTQQTSLLLETAAYAVHNCQERHRWQLQSNSTDAAAFYAIFFDSLLRIGYSVETGKNASGNELCVSVDAALPSGSSKRLRLRWRLRFDFAATADASTNISSNITVKTSPEDVFVPDTNSSVVSVDHFVDPPVTRALPCPYLCPAALADTAACKFAWLHASNKSNPVAYRPPDPNLGGLSEPHRLLLLPWKPPGNPGPPPLSGAWVCRSAAAVTSSTSSSSLKPASQFRVQVAARPSLCGNQPPKRSVVFVPRFEKSSNSSYKDYKWSTHQSLSFNCTVCGLNENDYSISDASKVDAEISVHGSLGGVEASATSLAQKLPGGGVELSLRFTELSLASDESSGGSILVRCRAVDRRGRGLLAFAAVEALPAPSSGAVLDADCRENGDDKDMEYDGTCHRFRCPLEPQLAATLPRLGVSVAYLFTLQPANGAPPQQTLTIGVDRLSTHANLIRLRCTQLLYYANDNDSKDGSGGRRQRYAAGDAAKEATHRAALGERRYSRLLLAVESNWLEVVRLDESEGSRPLQQSDDQKTDDQKTDDSGDGGEKSINSNTSIRVISILLCIVLALCALVAIAFIVLHYRRQIWRALRFIANKGKGRENPDKSAEASAGTQTATSTATSEDADAEAEKKI